MAWKPAQLFAAHDAKGQTLLSDKTPAARRRPATFPPPRGRESIRRGRKGMDVHSAGDGENLLDRAERAQKIGRLGHREFGGLPSSRAAASSDQSRTVSSPSRAASCKKRNERERGSSNAPVTATWPARSCQTIVCPHFHLKGAGHGRLRGDEQIAAAAAGIHGAGMARLAARSRPARSALTAGWRTVPGRMVSQHFMHSLKEAPRAATSRGTASKQSRPADPGARSTWDRSSFDQRVVPSGRGPPA